MRISDKYHQQRTHGPSQLRRPELSKVRAIWQIEANANQLARARRHHPASAGICGHHGMIPATIREMY
jgi:hypothetical protein